MTELLHKGLAVEEGISNLLQVAVGQAANSPGSNCNRVQGPSKHSVSISLLQGFLITILLHLGYLHAKPISASSPPERAWRPVTTLITIPIASF